jgi:subtilase family serine protease
MKIPRRARLSAVSVAVLVVLPVLAGATGPKLATGLERATVASRSGAVAMPSAIRIINTGYEFPAPLSTTDCQALVGIRCYSPLQYRTAYDVSPLYNDGITGAGQTIVIVDSYGSPTVVRDLQTFDAEFGLPNPELQVIPFGAVPPFDPTNSDEVGWATESTLDVEYAHAMAPGAKIVLAETAVSETEGVTGFPEMMAAEKYLIDQGIGDVISQSFGATENTFPGFARGHYSSLLKLRYAFADAKAHRVTVLGASGDSGATDYRTDGTTLYPHRVDSWPSSDPLVTSVGGSQLYLDDNGDRVAPDSVWNDGFGAGGGGLSRVFSRPPFQLGVKSTVRAHRGTPDISMSGAISAAAWVYWSFAGAGAPGWELVGGTSEATPIFAGIVALADQVARHRLGNINPHLYSLGLLRTRIPQPTGIQDITQGNNTFNGVAGFIASPGYDLASGWGTIDAAEFVPALASVGERRANQDKPSSSSSSVATPGRPRTGSRRSHERERSVGHSRRPLSRPRTRQSG